MQVSSTPDGGLGGGEGSGGGGVAGSPGDAADGGKGSADSLASPSAARTSMADTRCVLCNTTLALADGTPKLMECLHSACEPCIRAKLEEKQASSRDFLGAYCMKVLH